MFATRRFIAASLAVSSFAFGAPASAADSDATDIYVVESGDSIYGIAYAQGVSVTELMSANDLEITSIILPGQRLTIPGTSGPASPPPSTAPSTPSASDGGSSYTIVPGDTLSGIASKRGVRLSALLTANRLQISSLILPGQRLTIPGSTPSAPDSPNSGTDTGSNTTVASTATYQVQPGDWLARIASKHDVRLGDLLAVNGLRADSVIHPGRLLKLPAGAAVVESKPAVTPTPTPAPKPIASATTDTSPADTPTTSLTHTVVAGNSLSGIAALYTVKLADLLAVNNLQVDALILPGQVLQLPAGATPPNTANPAPAPASTAPVSSATQSRVDTVVAYALAQVGKNYSFFTKGPDSFDCSGLTLSAYRQVGIDLVHWSAAQANQGTRVDLDSDGIRAGDLVFQQRNGSLVINHVGIAIDGNRWVHAVGPGKGVRIGTLPDASTISTVRRYISD